MTVEWQGVVDNLDCDFDVARAAGIDTAKWPARVERDDDGSVRFVIAGDGKSDFSGSIRPSRCRDADPEIPAELVAELVAAGELEA